MNKRACKRCFANYVAGKANFTGIKPFIEDEDNSVMQRILIGKYAKPRSHFSDIPRKLQSIIRNCLHIDPNKRYQETEQLRQDLEWYCSRSIEVNYAGRLVLFLRNRDLISDSEAETFVRDAESRLLSLWIEAGRAAWVQNNFITDDTNAIAAAANAQVMAATTDLAAVASRFNALDPPQPLDRKLTLLKTSLSAVAPSDSALQTELATLMTEMESLYGQGEYCGGISKSK